VATLFAVLFAVFAMHGLASHDLAHGSTAPSAVPGVVADSHVGSEHGHAGTQEPDRNREPSPGQDGHLDGSMCLALLCLLAALLALALRRGVQTRPLIILRRRANELLPRGRPAEPPCLYRLSILSC
jgi:hypothetical protein